MRTFVYIDGFNFYYGAVKNTPYKWLDFSKFCQHLLPSNQILKIKYFTARVKARPSDPRQPIRQQTYLRALQTIPNLEVVYGSFLTKTISMPVVNPLSGQPKFVKVSNTEEKGSDVNIAAHMIHDGHLDLYDVAVLVSNDSDLVEPVRIVRYELGKVVGLINPHKRPSYELKKHVNFIRQVRKGVLQNSQFPPTLQDSRGTFYKPKAW